ncbi:MAG TPA: DUF1150 family protein [Azospirillaceae bacterium]|nr:DUF1150 family protein [Azospirillaceae bacterium]
MNTTITETLLRQLSSKELAALGMDHVAYIKMILVNGSVSYSIHAADGTPLTIMGERDTAIAAVKQHDMEPVLVH